MTLTMLLKKNYNSALEQDTVGHLFQTWCMYTFCDFYVDYIVNCVVGQRTQLRDSGVQSRSGRGVYWCNCH